MDVPNIKEFFVNRSVYRLKASIFLSLPRPRLQIFDFVPGGFYSVSTALFLVFPCEVRC